MLFALPGPMEPSDDERASLVTFLQAKRGDVVRASEGLDEKRAALAPAPGLLSITGIINHLTHVEERWIDGRYLAMPFRKRTEEFEVSDSVTLTDALEAYEARAARTDHAIAEAESLLTPCLGTEEGRPPAHVLLGLSAPVNLRWVVLHLIEETAHHAGHADASRTLTDGRTGAELLQAVRARVGA